MAFTSPLFIAFLLLVVLATNLSRAPAWRAAVLLAANVVFIGSYVEHPVQLVPLAAFLALGWGLLEAVRRTRSSAVLAAGLVLVLATFVVLKRFSFLGDFVLPFPYLLIGLSYILFRVLHLLVDARQGELAGPVPPLQFFNYTCNFLAFTAGPIQRYPDHAAAAAQPAALDEQRVYAAFARAIAGFVKVGVVSAVFNYLFEHLSTRLLGPAPLAWSVAVPLYVAAAVTYTVYLYANFSGYMDIVIGVGQLIGQQLPENFNRPFLARNFLEFWSRWHMTLSDWFKTYLFNPLLKALATRVTAPQAGPYLGVAAFFVTFLVMGVWHGTTAVFVVYGLLMGAGASVNKLWQVWLTRRLGKKAYKAWCERTPVVYLSRGMTLAYFALALTCLWVEMPQLLALLRQLGLLGGPAAYAGLAVAAGAVFWAWDTAMAWLSPLRAGVLSASGGVVARNLVLAVQVLLIVTVASFFHKAPEFVYRAF